MISPRVRGFVAAAVAVLAACGEGPRQPERLRVAARSGATIDVSRTTWEAPCADVAPVEGRPTRSIRPRIVHGEEGVVSYGEQAFPEPACAGTPLEEPFSTSVSFLAFADGTKTMSWSGAPLPEHPGAPVATRVFLENQIAFATDCFWVDDVASPRVLYASPASAPGSDGYPDQLSALGFAEIR